MISTTLLIERRPTFSKICFSQAGLGPTFTPRINRAVYRGQSSGASTRTAGTSATVSVMAISGKRNGWPVNAASSRARPITLNQSGRFGVTSISKTVSPGPRYSENFFPTGASAGKISKPSSPFGKPSSSVEHIIPCDSTPRSFDTLIAKPAGIAAPGNASGTLSPTL